MNAMPLFCRGCSETAGEQVYQAAKEFPKREVAHLWQGVIALGMGRFCKQCSNARAGAACVRLGTVHGVEGGRPSQEDAEVECVGCRPTKSPCQAFDAERVNIWKMKRDITTIAKCKACWAKLPDGVRNAEKKTWKHSLFTCSDCNSELPPHKFDTAKFAKWEETSTLYFAKCGN